MLVIQVVKSLALPSMHRYTRMHIQKILRPRHCSAPKCGPPFLSISSKFPALICIRIRSQARFATASALVQLEHHYGPVVVFSHSLSIVRTRICRATAPDT